MEYVVCIGVIVACFGWLGHRDEIEKRRHELWRLARGGGKGRKR